LHTPTTLTADGSRPDLRAASAISSRILRMLSPTADMMFLLPVKH